jgi:hypothetical protein
MGLFDFILGDEATRKALADKTYLDPTAVPEGPERDAARSAARRMDFSNRFGKAAMAIAQANQKKAGIGDVLGAFGGGFAAGGQDLQAEQLKAAQIRGTLAQAKQREATGALGGLLKGPSGRIGKGPDGMLYEVWRDGSTHVLPAAKMKGYAGQNVPPLDQVTAEVRAETLKLVGNLNPNQTTLAGTTPAPAPTSTGPVQVRTIDEAKRLPPGTRFIGPDGVLRER